MHSMVVDIQALGVGGPGGKHRVVFRVRVLASAPPEWGLCAFPQFLRGNSDHRAEITSQNIGQILFSVSRLIG